MKRSVGRYLAARAATGGAAALLLVLPGAGAHGAVAPLVLVLAAASSLGAAAILRRRPALSRPVLASLIGLDLAVESLLVALTGAARSPFVLLYPLTIASSGLVFGMLGSSAVTVGAVAGYWAAIVRTGGGPAGAPGLTSAFLLLLGVLNGLLARRAAAQSREMDRVRVELERIMLDAEAIVASLETPLICLDRRGEIRRANRAAVRLLALTEGREGVPLAEAGDRAGLDPLLDLIDEAFLRGRESSGEIVLPGANGDGPRPVEVLISCVRDRDGGTQGLVLLLNDLTRRKEMEAEHARRERLAGIGELSGHLAHEIRNSLKPVVGSIELLAGEIPQGGTAGELMAIILKESETLEAFLSDFLIFSRDKTLTIEEVDLDTVIRAEIAAVSKHPARAPGVELSLASGTSEGTAYVDREAIRTVLRNLLVNALEATPAGRVRVSRESTEEGLRIIVEDTGVGLPEVDPESLFEPFCTHKPGGTGLGLSIARRLARRLGGDLVLEPGDCQGTRAVLVLEKSGVTHRAA